MKRPVSGLGTVITAEDGDVVSTAQVRGFSDQTQYAKNGTKKRRRQLTSNRWASGRVGSIVIPTFR